MSSNAVSENTNIGPSFSEYRERVAERELSKHRVPDFMARNGILFLFGIQHGFAQIQGRSKDHEGSHAWLPSSFSEELVLMGRRACLRSPMPITLGQIGRLLSSCRSRVQYSRLSTGHDWPRQDNLELGFGKVSGIGALDSNKDRLPDQRSKGRSLIRHPYKAGHEKSQLDAGELYRLAIWTKKAERRLKLCSGKSRKNSVAQCSIKLKSSYKPENLAKMYMYVGPTSVYPTNMAQQPRRSARLTEQALKQKDDTV
ncbi:MAG: hypothetical protein J3Q66DRAFT_397089 [Benniella sp.]|nr:MAG: hypothetical protein J3Q66DRAFT_397089 [Benniella sp.]